MDTMRAPMRRESRQFRDENGIGALFGDVRISPWVFREAGEIAFGALLYFLVRGLMETRVGLATSHAESLINIERSLGIFHEPAIQAFVMQWDWLVTLANRVYIFGHWPVIIGTLVWLLLRHRESFPLYRSALLLSGLIGLVFFVMIPMSPPRFLADQGFIDTVTQGSNAYRVLQPPAFTNQYAAMLSLHVGWNLLMGIAIYRQSSWLGARIFGVAMPLIMFLATIATANHYFLDGLVGSVVALTGLAIAWRISRPQSRPVTAHVAPIRPIKSRVLGQGWAQDRAA